MRGLIGETISMVSIWLLFRKEEETGEDLKKIFGSLRPRYYGTAKIPSVSSRVCHVSPMAKIPLCDIR